MPTRVYSVPLRRFSSPSLSTPCSSLPVQVLSDPRSSLALLCQADAKQGCQCLCGAGIVRGFSAHSKTFSLVRLANATRSCTLPPRVWAMRFVAIPQHCPYALFSSAASQTFYAVPLQAGTPPCQCFTLHSISSAELGISFSVRSGRLRCSSVHRRAVALPLHATPLRFLSTPSHSFSRNCRAVADRFYAAPQRNGSIHRHTFASLYISMPRQTVLLFAQHTRDLPAPCRRSSKRRCAVNATARLCEAVPLPC